MKQGLYQHGPGRDSCGFGLIASLHGVASHALLNSAITALINMQHRGGLNADDRTSDGCGLLLQMPDRFIRTVAAETLGTRLGEHYGVGNLFLPTDAEQAAGARQLMERELEAAGFVPRGWREVPVNRAVCGEIAILSLPRMEQIFFDNPRYSSNEAAAALLRVRIRVEKILQDEPMFYISSLSCSVICYKALVMPESLADFYPDLRRPELETAICVFHVRYSTNTLPAWYLAQPFRFLAHNGEINTIIGNRNWATARVKNLRCELLPDIEELAPLVNTHGSDSSSLDNMLEVLVAGGMTPHKALQLLVPRAWENESQLSPEAKAFYRYYSRHLEPWDGPAGMVMTDGRYAVCALDRNGLRPARYYLTDDFLIAASEVGVIDCAADSIVAKGRVEPGGILVVDTVAKKVLSTESVSRQLSTEHNYGQWLKKYSRRLSSQKKFVMEGLGAELRLSYCKLFQLCADDYEQVLKPLALGAVEGTGSMGDDTPIVPLSNTRRPLYDMFRQQFAQVTNPPIDSLRESIAMSLNTCLGKEQNIFVPRPEYARSLELDSPILTPAEYGQLLAETDEFSPCILNCSYEPGETLLEGIDRLVEQAVSEVRSGAVVLVLSDQNITAGLLPIHSLLAVGAVHSRLIRENLRCDCNIVIASGSAHNTHHIAALIGFGATAVYPWLGIEMVCRIASEPAQPPLDQLTDNYRRGLEKGVLKILSKMGISTISAYRGAALFDIVGLDCEVTDICFAGVESPLGGMNFTDLDKEVRELSKLAWDHNIAQASGGVFKFIHDSEFHAFNPDVVQSLHRAVRSGKQDDYEEFAELVNGRKPAMLRDLLNFAECQPIPLQEVEGKEAVLKRFDTAGMSLGALSPEAHETLAIAMNRLGGHSNSGEGGEDPARYRDERCSKIKQIASGRFGVTAHYLVNAEILQIKIAQGAKPGEGGQLPGDKVSELIARLRCSVPGVSLISPPPHHDIYSIEDLAQLIYDLKEVNRQALVSVKLVSGSGVGTIAAGVAKAGADLITVSGHDGGTGASPLSSIRYAGCPWETGLSETHQALRANGLRERVILQVDGGLKTGLDVVKGAVLGADSFGFGTVPMVAMGCKYLRICHLNNCATGVATQQDRLRSKHFVGSAEAVVNYFNFVAEEVRVWLSRLGCRSLLDLVGRVDLLQVVDDITGDKLNFEPVLSQGPAREDTPHYGSGQRNPVRGEHDLADRLMEDYGALIRAGESAEGSYQIRNVHRSIGAGLSGEIARHHGASGLGDSRLELNFNGTAGQSFGAWNAPGLLLNLTGDANDYVGKGMSGGRIVLRPPAAARFEPHLAPIAGNTCLYGATGGELYACGRAGERFAVRNSGCQAVVEGIGNHGCEYMTGGTVLLLGSCGVNFGAGMTNGVAFVYDRDNDFHSRCNQELVQILSLQVPQLDGFEGLLKSLLNAHYRYTGSTVAGQVLSAFQQERGRFLVVVPRRDKQFLRELLDKEIGRRNTAAEISQALDGKQNFAARREHG